MTRENCYVHNSDTCGGGIHCTALVMSDVGICRDRRINILERLE